MKFVVQLKRIGYRPTNRIEKDLEIKDVYAVLTNLWNAGLKNISAENRMEVEDMEGIIQGLIEQHEGKEIINFKGRIKNAPFHFRLEGVWGEDGSYEPTNFRFFEAYYTNNFDVAGIKQKKKNGLAKEVLNNFESSINERRFVPVDEVANANEEIGFVPVNEVANANEDRRFVLVDEVANANEEIGFVPVDEVANANEDRRFVLVDEVANANEEIGFVPVDEVANANEERGFVPVDEVANANEDRRFVLVDEVAKKLPAWAEAIKQSLLKLKDHPGKDNPERELIVVDQPKAKKEQAPKDAEVSSWSKSANYAKDKLLQAVPHALVAIGAYAFRNPIMSGLKVIATAVGLNAAIYAARDWFNRSTVANNVAKTADDLKKLSHDHAQAFLDGVDAQKNYLLQAKTCFSFKGYHHGKTNFDYAAGTAAENNNALIEKIKQRKPQV